jgi:AcrR family transcriptional regulator
LIHCADYHNPWNNFFVPKIVTENLASHRNWRRNQLIAAATEIALEESSANISIAAVAARAGLSRTSVYEYFASSQDLVADLLIEELKSFADLLAKAIENQSDPISALTVWIETSLNYVADGRHLLAKSLHATTLPRERSAEIATAHRKMLAPLSKTLADLGIADTARALSQLQALTDVATRRIESGAADAADEIAMTTEFYLLGVKALTKTFN